MGSSSSLSLHDQNEEITNADNPANNNRNRHNEITSNSKIRRGFELYKMEKENEIKSLKKRINKLENDGRRLRGELKTLEKMMTQLKTERDNAIEAEIKTRNSIIDQKRKQIMEDECERENSFPSPPPSPLSHENYLPNKPQAKISLPAILKTKTFWPTSENAIQSTDDEIYRTELLCGGYLLDEIEENSLLVSIGLRCWSSDNRWIPQNQLSALTNLVVNHRSHSPFLVIGSLGSGKSLLLSHWISTLPADYTVVYHEVSLSNSIASHPGLMMRRVTIKVTYALGLSFNINVNPNTTNDLFSQFLEKISANLNNNTQFILILDSADKFQNIASLSWLLEPLPINVRVVLSVDAENCPVVWNSFPCLHLSPLPQSTIRSLLFELNFLTTEQISSVIENTRGQSALYIKILFFALDKWGREPNVLKQMLEEIRTKPSTIDLYLSILKRLRQSSPQCPNDALDRIFGVLSASSPYGIPESSLSSLINYSLDDWWIIVLRDLVSFQIVDSSPIDQTINLANDVIREAINRLELSKTTLEWKRDIINYYQSLIHNEIIPTHVANHLPRLLMDAGDRDKFTSCLSNVWFFFSLYTRNHCGLLLDYWSSIDIEPKSMARIYVSFNFTADANVLESLGIFFRDLNLYDESYVALQRALEIREAIFDPDHPIIAQSLHQLAVLFHNWGKISASLTRHRQALDIYENTLGFDHKLAIREQNALEHAYKKLNRC